MPDDPVHIHVDDSVKHKPGDDEYFEMVLTNPPFGRKSSVTYVTEVGKQTRVRPTPAQTRVRI